MQALDLIRKEIQIVDELSDISEVLEQTAAKSIIETREKILKSRTFFEEAWKIYNVLKQLTDVNASALEKNLVIIVTPNRGMCGSLMNRVITEGEKLYKEKKADLLITGEKGHSYFINKDERTIHFFSVSSQVTYEEMEPLKEVIAKYLNISLVFPRYINLSKQEVKTVELKSAVDNIVKDKKEIDDHLSKAKQFIIEPGVQEVVDYLNKTIIGILFFDYFAESILAYNAAQMVAMHDAHDNATKQLKVLNLSLNKKKRAYLDSKMRDLYKFKFLDIEV